MQSSHNDRYRHRLRFEVIWPFLSRSSINVEKDPSLLESIPFNLDLGSESGAVKAAID